MCVRPAVSAKSFQSRAPARDASGIVQGFCFQLESRGSSETTKWFLYSEAESE
jgi:hypothetical protein